MCNGSFPASRKHAQHVANYGHEHRKEAEQVQKRECAAVQPVVADGEIISALECIQDDIWDA
jgi:hypothetical protein